MSNDDGMTAARHGRSPIGCADEVKPRCNVSIDLDERGFWHISCYLIHDDPGDDGDVPDGCSTTKKGATLDEAIALARNHYAPERITIWEPCEECGGTGVIGDYDHEIDTCYECEDGQQPRNIDGAARSASEAPGAAAVNPNPPER